MLTSEPLCRVAYFMEVGLRSECGIASNSTSNVRRRELALLYTCASVYSSARQCVCVFIALHGGVFTALLGGVYMCLQLCVAVCLQLCMVVCMCVYSSVGWCVCAMCVYHACLCVCFFVVCVFG